MPQPEGQMLNATVTAQSRLQTPEQFRNIIVKADPSGARVLLERRRAGRARRRQLFRDRSAPTAIPAPASASSLEPGANALAHGRPGQGQGRANRAAHAGRLPLRLRQRHHRLHQAVGQGGREDAGRGDPARRPRHVRLPAKLAGDADPVHRGAGRAARHLRDPLRARLLDQHDDPVRAGARDRPAGRRRHRRRRECRAAAATRTRR